jgi:hypothetical protein
MANNTANLQQLFSQTFQTAVTQVSAATFDSNLLPASTSPLNLGFTGNAWNSINNVMFFSGSNVGIGISSPHTALQVHGDLYSDTFSGGLILRDSGGQCWRITVSTGGALQTATSTTGCRRHSRLIHSVHIVAHLLY